MSPGSADEGSTSRPQRHRLQRQKAQSRKTFRFRKSRRGNNFEMSALEDQTGEVDTGASGAEPSTPDAAAPCEIPETIDEVSLPLSPRPPPAEAAPQPVILSDVSPTSSSAAYRESLWLDEEDLCQLQTLRESTPARAAR
ncbi:uncharacterized protein LOC119097727 [Pollicipes pollicipes]|uniref:uncharacterized protein LOC119097727 n=1 Tax=Pollicipes pollicipes TaxID=41117 RepID=UPI0018851B32|nr:uncharacterized protein LOC119097727 [Pollicipes pollicipes]